MERYKTGDLLGIEFRSDHAHVFFGYRWAPLELLAARFPQYRFRELRQVHGRTVIPAPETPVEADGHWADAPHTAVIVKTADCLPVLLTHPNRVCAVHAGWRGLEAEILPAGVAVFAGLPGGVAKVKAYIGPHIQRSNFEVGADVARKLEAAFLRARGPLAPFKTIVYPHPDPQKNYVDLRALAVVQLVRQGVPGDHIEVVDQDTFGSTDLHSFRRDRSATGRNFNFVTRLA